MSADEQNAGNAGEGQTEIHQALRIAKLFTKFIPLPNRANWKVHKSDVLYCGRAISLLRTKRRFLMPDDLSSLKQRAITVTRHGFMIIYEQQTTGLIIDLRAASHVTCNADKFKGRTDEYTRCHVKIKLPRGNVHLFVRDGEVHRWTCAVMQAISVNRGEVLKSKEERKKKTSTPSTSTALPEAADVKVEPDELEELEVSQSPITVIEKSPSPPRVPVSVRSLREKLEKELVIRSKADVVAEQQRRFSDEQPSFISSLFLPYEPPVDEVLIEDDDREVFREEKSILMMPTEAAEREKEAPKKDWWNRSLRC